MAITKSGYEKATETGDIPLNEKFGIFVKVIKFESSLILTNDRKIDIKLTLTIISK